MIKSFYHKTLIVLIGFLMVISGSVFLFPIKTVNYIPKPSQGVDLTIIMQGDQKIPGVENITDDFLASPLGQGVDSLTILYSGPTSDSQLTYLQTLMQGGSATAHVIDIDTTWMPDFAKNGWLVNLDPYLETGELDVYSPGMVVSCEYQGNYYAYPYFMNLGILYYRKDLIDIHFGVGMWDESDFDTWEKLNATANFILNNESGLLDNLDLVGYIGQFDTYEGGVVNFFEWCGSNGALDLVTSMNEVNINATKVKEAMDFISALVAPQYTGVQGNDYIISRIGLVSDEASSGNLWLANNTIFLRQWPYIYGLSESANIDFGIAPLPHFAAATGFKTSCAAGSILAVPTATTGIARETAVNLTKFLGDSLAQESELTADIDPYTPGIQPQGNFPALKSIYANPPAGFEWIKNWSDQVELTLSRPIHPKYPQISDIIADYFNDLLSGAKSVDVALSEMQIDIQELIQTPPGSFTLISTAEDPDPDGIFNLTWMPSDEAMNYSVYQYDKFITEINRSLTSLTNETSDLMLPLSGYTDGTYYFVIVAHNEYGDTLSNCIEVIVQISKEPEIPGYNTFFLIVVISIVLIFIVKKWHNQIIKI